MIRLAVTVLFLLSIAFFTERGLYRVLRDPSRAGDFSTVYAASRCWMNRGNPYARIEFLPELARSGAPPAAVREQDRHNSAYFVSAMPFVAAVAWLPWRLANAVWCLLSVGCFAVSLGVISRNLPLPIEGKLVATSCCLFFCPTYVGILNGNPGVLSIALTVLALYFAVADRSRASDILASGILLGVALCIKPQIALCGLMSFVLWKRWTPLAIGLALATLTAISATWWVSSFGHRWEWLASFEQNMTADAAPGGLSDPRPSSPYASGFLNAQTVTYLITPDPWLSQALVLIAAAALIGCYVYFARNRAGEPTIDMAFLATVTIALAYHRYYDAQLLLLLLPAAVLLWQTGRRISASALGICFALMAFPLEPFVLRAVGPVAGAGPSLAQVAMLRLYPISILATALILSFCPFGTRGTAQEGPPNMAVN